MKVRVDLGLDFEGHHTLGWQPSESTGALEVPRATLERWLAEREAFKVASLRWKRVIEEVEEQLYRAERDRLAPRPTEASTTRLTTRARKSTELAAQLAEQVAERVTERPADPGGEAHATVDIVARHSRGKRSR